MEQHDTEEKYTCESCSTNIKIDAAFCHNCGAPNLNAGHISIFNNNNLRSAFIFYLLYFFICLTVKYTDWFDSYDHLFWIEILLAAITFFFAKANWPSLKPVLRFNHFRWTILAGVILLAIIFSSVITLSIKQINISVFHTNVNMFDSYRDYQFPVLLMFYSVALVPAIFEELAFRGIIYNYLGTFLPEGLVVTVTGVVFAAIHLNFFSMLWLVPFGIFIGTLRKKYNTIWYGVIFHFVFNITACLFDLYNQGAL